MVEPISVVLGVLYSGVGKVLWDGAVSGIVGNTAHGWTCDAARAIRMKLLKRRGLAENHDIAKALRAAQLKAVEYLLNRYERAAGENAARRFLAKARKGLAAAVKATGELSWDAETEAAMFASYQQAFREPTDDNDAALTADRLAEQATETAWAELLSWAKGLAAPDDLKRRFRGETAATSWFEAWSAELVDIFKSDHRFEAAFFSGKLVEIGDLAIEGRDALARLEVETAAARDDIKRCIADAAQDIRGDVQAEGAASAARDGDLRTLVEQQHAEVLARLDAMAAARGQSFSPEARAAAAETLAEVSASTAPALARAQAGIADDDPQAVADGLVQAAGADKASAAERYRGAGSIYYAFDVAAALDAYAKAAILEPEHCWTHIFLSRLYQVAGDTTRAREAAEAGVNAAGNSRDRSCAIFELGDIAIMEGDLLAARDAYLEYQSVARAQATRDPKNTKWQRDLLVSYDRLGDVARQEGDLPAARKTFEDSLKIADTLVARDPNNAEWQRGLLVSFNKLGEVARQEGDLPAAREAFEASLKIADALAARNPRNTEWQRDLSISFNKLGDVAGQEGDLPAARKAFEDSLKIADALTARDPNNAEWQRDQSVSYDRLGEVASLEGDLPAARKAFEDGLKIADALAARDPRNTEWQRDLSVSFDNLGDVAYQEGDLPAARKAFEDSLKIRNALAARDPKNTQWQRDLSISYERLGDLAEASGDLPGAVALYESSQPIVERLAAMDRTNAEFQRDLEISRRRLEQLRGKPPVDV